MTRMRGLRPFVVHFKASLLFHIGINDPNEGIETIDKKINFLC